MNAAARPLAGKAIVVIGAGRGIGAAVAEYLGAQGARMFAADVNGDNAAATAAKMQAQGAEAAAAKVDVSDWKDCEALIAAAVARFGRIDGLVNFAGIHYLRTPFEETDGEAARRLFEVNVLGTYYVGVQTLQQMKRQGGGVLVNCTSGGQAGIAATAAYCGSKGSVASLTYAWAMDAAPHGIRVNAISPTATSQMTDATDAYMRRNNPGWTRAYVDPATNAPPVAYLLSDASKALNGQIIRVDGSQLQLMAHPAVLHPVMENAAWDVGSIADAVEKTFGNRLPPLGMTGIEGSFKPLSGLSSRLTHR